MNELKTVKQIMPAPNWFVVYKSGRKEVRRPLAGFALIHVGVSDSGSVQYDYVVGFDMLNGDGWKVCDNSPNFLRFEYVP